MNTAWRAIATSVALCLLSGIESLGTDSYAQNQRLASADDRDSGQVELPEGAQLLKSDATSCRGTLLASNLGRYGGDVYGIEEGDQSVFQVIGSRIPWACLDQDFARAGTMACPDATSYLRLSLRGDQAMFECFGAGRDR
jgi:hypothetical protein